MYYCFLSFIFAIEILPNHETFLLNRFNLISISKYYQIITLLIELSGLKTYVDHQVSHTILYKCVCVH